MTDRALVAKKLALIESYVRELRDLADPGAVVAGPETNHELFDRLAGAGWISEAQRRVLTSMAGFRNILVHGYAAVDPVVVRDVLEHHLVDLTDFVETVRARLPAGD